MKRSEVPIFIILAKATIGVLIIPAWISCLYFSFSLFQGSNNYNEWTVPAIKGFLIVAKVSFGLILGAIIMDLANLQSPKRVQEKPLTLEYLKAQLRPYKNTLVIDLDKIVRLVDVVEEEDDFYWIYDSRAGKEYNTCCGRWIPLKGYIPKEEYERMLHIWNLNNEAKAV